MHSKIIVSGAAMMIAVGSLGVSAALATSSLPTEQQGLINDGYTETASWGKFTKTFEGCTVTVELSGTNYYVVSKGGLSASFYPVRPGHVVDAAQLAMDNCQS